MSESGEIICLTVSRMVSIEAFVSESFLSRETS